MVGVRWYIKTDFQLTKDKWVDREWTMKVSNPFYFFLIKKNEFFSCYDMDGKQICPKKKHTRKQNIFIYIPLAWHLTKLNSFWLQQKTC